ncbi:MAG: isocitrate lyase/phosphoenolpyruvate mutase family protein [Frankiaceae bacterium]|nr:isocitrate lyase/phosphoenolpyruvate mutase family protein [Frankiaceae bacterium]
MPTMEKIEQVERCEQFRTQHSTGPVLQIVNAWDATSARVLAAAGAPAIGTTSFGLAFAHGHPDGERIPWDQVCSIARSIVDAVDVPVTVDIEAGRGATAAEVRRSVADIIQAGAVGVNIEDSVPGRPGEMFPPEVQAARHAAAREACVAADIPLFINARCDVYFGADVPETLKLDEVFRRAEIYTAAGVDGLFLPGLLDPVTLSAITGAVELPVNVMVGTGAPDLDALVAAGVRRTSQGGEPFIAAAGMLTNLTDRYLEGSFGAPIHDLGAGVALLERLVG